MMSLEDQQMVQRMNQRILKRINAEKKRERLWSVVVALAISAYAVFALVPFVVGMAYLHGWR